MMARPIMTNPYMNFLALALYLTAGVMLLRGLMRGERPTDTNRVTVLALCFFAVVTHGSLLNHGIHLTVGFNLSLTGAISLVAWVVALLYLAVSLSRPVDNLGVIILPIAGGTVIAAWLWPGWMPIGLSARPEAVHVVISILAYSLLCLAAIQSLMVLAQENRLRHHATTGFIRALPPMEIMEEIMFRMIWFGFFLLTLTLVSGLFFSEAVFGTPMPFTHHVVLSALAWVVYGVLLFGRLRYGWRGRTAVHWTLGGFGLLVLAYFGTKFVLEILLHR